MSKAEDQSLDPQNGVEPVGEAQTPEDIAKLYELSSAEGKRLAAELKAERAETAQLRAIAEGLAQQKAEPQNAEPTSDDLLSGIVDEYGTVDPNRLATTVREMARREASSLMESVLGPQRRVAEAEAKYSRSNPEFAKSKQEIYTAVQQDPDAYAIFSVLAASEDPSSAMKYAHDTYTSNRARSQTVEARGGSLTTTEELRANRTHAGVQSGGHGHSAAASKEASAARNSAIEAARKKSLSGDPTDAINLLLGPILEREAGNK